MPIEPLYAILEQIRQGRCSLFVGAGLSTVCRMPSSQDIAKEISKFLLKSFPVIDREVVTENEKDLGKISRLYQEVAKDEFAPHRFVQDRLIQAESKADTDLYQKLAKITFPYIINTNYDRLIEQTRKTEIRPRNIVKDETGAGSVILGKETILVKMHGDLESYQSMILTEAELHGYQNTHKAMADLILQILKQGPMLFLGFSKTAGSFIDIAVNYLENIPTNLLPHPWFIIDHSPDRQLIASFKNENCVIIKEDLPVFIDNLYNSYSEPDFLVMPSGMGIPETLNRLAFQVKETEDLLTKIQTNRQILQAPEEQHIKEIHFLNELEVLHTEADILSLSLEIIEDGIKKANKMSKEDIDAALEEAKETFEPVRSKVTRDADQRLTEIGFGETTPKIGNILDDDIFHKKYRKYLKLFKPQYGDNSLSLKDIQKQEDRYAEVLSLWKNNRQAEYFAEYYRQKYHDISKVWPPKGGDLPTIEEIQRFIPIENLREIYSDSVFLQSVKIGLQRLEGALENNSKFYKDQGLLVVDLDRPAALERITKQNMQETRARIEQMKTEIAKRRAELE